MFKHGGLPVAKAQHRKHRSKHISRAVNLCPGVGDLLALLVPRTNKSFNAETISDSVSGVSEYFCSILKICFSLPICLLRQGHLCLVIERESSIAHIELRRELCPLQQIKSRVHVTQHITVLIYDKREKNKRLWFISETQQYWIVLCSRGEKIIYSNYFITRSRPVKFSDKSFIYKSKDLDCKYFWSNTYLFMMLVIINF